MALFKVLDWMTKSEEPHHCLHVETSFEKGVCRRNGSSITEGSQEGSQEESLATEQQIERRKIIQTTELIWFLGKHVAVRRFISEESESNDEKKENVPLNHSINYFIIHFDWNFCDYSSSSSGTDDEWMEWKEKEI